MQCSKAQQSTSGIFQKSWLSREPTSGAITLDKGWISSYGGKGQLERGGCRSYCQSET